VSANIECNAVSAVQVTHHFLKRMVSLMTVVMHRTLWPRSVQPSQIRKEYKCAAFCRSKLAITADPQLLLQGSTACDLAARSAREHHTG
jgi:hypothetical protein